MVGFVSLGLARRRRDGIALGGSVSARDEFDATGRTSQDSTTKRGPASRANIAWGIAGAVTVTVRVRGHVVRGEDSKRRRRLRRTHARRLLGHLGGDLGIAGEIPRIAAPRSAGDPKRCAARGVLKIRHEIARLWLRRVALASGVCPATPSGFRCRGRRALRRRPWRRQPEGAMSDEAYHQALRAVAADIMTSPRRRGGLRDPRCRRRRRDGDRRVARATT